MNRPIFEPVTDIEGRLERIVYYNPDNHYFIGKLQQESPRQRITVVGYMPQPSPGESLRIKGSWQTHPKYGQQFKIDTYQVRLPSTVEGIRDFLASGLIRGIGAKTAARLVDRFQKETLHIIETDPDRLMALEGIGFETVRRITDGWREYQTARELMGFLQEHAIPAVYGAKLFKAYGSEAMTMLQSDPLQITRDMPRIGFYIVDKLMQDAGVLPDDPDRVAACIMHLVHLSAEDGDCFMTEQRLLAQCGDRFHIAADAARLTLDTLEADGDLVVDQGAGRPDTRAIYLRHLYESEVEIAAKVSALACHRLAPADIELADIEHIIMKNLAIQLSDQQLAVLQAVLKQRVAVITGGPGTGKTTLIRSITAVFNTEGKRCLLMAPTGRAARRLAEVSGHPAATIHKMLGYNISHGGFDRNRDNPLDADVIIVDEFSMVDVVLMARLLAAVHLSAQLIMVGDAFQLPSVGPGSVLADLIDSETIRTFELTDIFRQARQSPIIVNAHQVRRGEAFDQLREPEEAFVPTCEFQFLPESRPAAVAASVVHLCRRQIPAAFGLDPLHDIQVLVPMHKGVVGTINLNQVLQEALNPRQSTASPFGHIFKLGDKVMNLRNNYQKEVFNGDIGFVAEVTAARRQLSVDFDGRNVDYDFSETDELCLAYAISIHKSQGSEYPAVVIPLVMPHSVMLYRSLLYTAITRAKALVVLVGSPRAFAAAINNNRSQQRRSGLATRLAVAANGP